MQKWNALIYNVPVVAAFGKNPNFLLLLWFYDFKRNIVQKQIGLTTLQSVMNTKLSKHGFWHCHENRLNKMIQTIPHNLWVWHSSYFGELWAVNSPIIMEHDWIIAGLKSDLNLDYSRTLQVLRFVGKPVNFCTKTMSYGFG